MSGSVWQKHSLQGAQSRGGAGRVDLARCVFKWVCGGPAGTSNRTANGAAPRALPAMSGGGHGRNLMEGASPVSRMGHELQTMRFSEGSEPWRGVASGAFGSARAPFRAMHRRCAALARASPNGWSLCMPPLLFPRLRSSRSRQFAWKRFRCRSPSHGRECCRPSVCQAPRRKQPACGPHAPTRYGIELGLGEQQVGRGGDASRRRNDGLGFGAEKRELKVCCSCLGIA